MLAREYFEQVRSAAKELENARRTLERLRNREGIRAQDYSALGRSPGKPDPMAATEARIDFEIALQQGRCNEANAIVEEAMGILFGEDGNGGLAKLAGLKYATLLMHYYCRAENWRQVSDVLGLSPSGCKKLRNKALDLVEDFGIAHLKSGTGYSGM